MHKKISEESTLCSDSSFCYLYNQKIIIISNFNLNKTMEISPGCSLEGLMVKLKLQYFGHLIRRVDSLEKTLMLGQKKKGTTEVEMAAWHHQLDGHEFG